MASNYFSSLLLPSGTSFTKRTWCSHHRIFPTKVSNFEGHCISFDRGVEDSSTHKSPGDGQNLISRRSIFGLMLGLSAFGLSNSKANGGGLPPEEKPRLCDDACEKELENVPMITTETGLQYKDIKVGEGPSPPVGFQVAANYVAMVHSGQIFDRCLTKLQSLTSYGITYYGSNQLLSNGSQLFLLYFMLSSSSLEKGLPYIFRVGSGQVIKGLDEGILSMKVGGKRRLFIPGTLAFPKGLNSAPGRPRVAPNSPVIFDVSLEYIPGLDDE